MIDALTVGSSLLHLVLAAVWLGAMAYSLLIVQPRALKLLGAKRFEELAALLAHGARTSVLALMAGIALSGAFLVALAVREDDPGPLWNVLVAVKVVLLVAALAVFAWVSWSLWPKRIFAVDDELPSVRRSFRLAAFTLFALVGAQFVLGAAASSLS